MGTTISGDTGITFPDATTQSKAVSQTTPFAVTASATTGAWTRNSAAGATTIQGYSMRQRYI